MHILSAAKVNRLSCCKRPLLAAALGTLCHAHAEGCTFGSSSATVSVISGVPADYQMTWQANCSVRAHQTPCDLWAWQAVPAAVW